MFWGLRTHCVIGCSGQAVALRFGRQERETAGQVISLAGR
jgi:hypothetical protein